MMSERAKRGLVTMALWGSAILAGILGGCGAPTGTPDALCREAVAALRDADWERYRALTITPADFDLRANQISASQAPQSYVGSSVRPQQRQQLHDEFELAVASGVDWSKSNYAGLGEALEVGLSEGLSGVAIPYTTYRVQLNGANPPATQRLAIAVTEWNGGYRILGLALDAATTLR